MGEHQVSLECLYDRAQVQAWSAALCWAQKGPPQVIIVQGTTGGGTRTSTVFNSSGSFSGVSVYRCMTCSPSIAACSPGLRRDIRSVSRIFIRWERCVVTDQADIDVANQPQAIQIGAVLSGGYQQDLVASVGQF